MQVMETKKQNPRTMGKLFERIVKRLFSTPSIILIGSAQAGPMGVWKTGKTDFFLLLSEVLLDLGLIDEVASNIKIESKEHYTYIHDLESLKWWLHKDKSTKLYGFDEANIHLPSRRAMSNKSVDIIQVFPEISKARARLVVIGQMLGSLDSELRGTGWVKGAFQKVDLKTVYITSPFFKRAYTFHDIPPTSIKFDPYEQAPFTLKPVGPQTFQEVDMERVWEWANDKPWKLLYKHPWECNREVRKVMKELFRIYTLYTSISVGGITKEASV